MAENKVVALNLGPVTSYGLAKSKGFPGTEEAWVEKMMATATDDDVDALDEKIDDLDTKVDTQVETINATIEQEVGAVDTKADGIAANLTTLSGVVAQKMDTTVAQASFVPVPSASGAQGDALRNNGDGTTAWAPIGLPTDEQTGTAINAWLTAHPEATTTVQDGAITRAKLITDLQEKTDLAQNATAPAFDATVAYAAGAHVTYGGKLYVLPSGHEANATWADTTKTEVNLGGEVSDLKSAFLDVATPNIYIDDGVTTGAMIRADGTINTSIPDGAYTVIMPVKYGEKYKFAFSHDATSGGWGTRVSGYNGETHVQEIALIECSSSVEIKAQDLTIPSGVDGIRVSYYYYSSVTSAVLVRYADGFADVSAVDAIARTGKYVYPEWFGAVGDGVTDDTTALSQAVAYARDNGLILGGVAGKTYLITNTIDLTKVHICFNRATVKAGATLRYMFTVNSYNVDTPITFVIRDMVIDANNTSGGIWYQYALHNRLDNVDFLNVHQIAIANSPAEGSNVAGGGLYIRNCYLEGDASESSQGMFLNTSDDRVQLTILKDFHRGIYNNGTNLFQFVHTWMSKNVENTVCFYHNGGNVAMFGCHFDTYKYAIYRNTDQNLDLIGCLVYINTNLYGSWVDEQWVAGTTPYVIWCTQNCYAYTANVHFTNCSFNPLRTDMELTNTPYQRYQFRDCFFKDNVSGKINDVTVNLTKVTTDTIGDYVNLRQDGKWIKLNALVTPGSEFVAGYTAIMSIPSNYMYPETDDKTAYNAHGHAILYLDAATPSETLTVGVVLNSTSGVISISTPSTLDVSRVKSIEIAMRWPVKKSIAYYKG